MTAFDLCLELLNYESWLPWTGCYAWDWPLTRLCWVETQGRAMARCASRIGAGEESLPCSMLAGVMPDGAHRCPQHAVDWRLAQPCA